MAQWETFNSHLLANLLRACSLLYSEFKKIYSLHVIGPISASKTEKSIKHMDDIIICTNDTGKILALKIDCAQNCLNQVRDGHDSTGNGCSRIITVMDQLLGE